MDDNADFIREFVVEASEHLDQAEACLLTLSTDHKNSEAVQACFRALHTIKGLAGFLQLERIQALAHAAEQLLDHIRTGKLVCGTTQADVLLSAISRLGELRGGFKTSELRSG
jgi:two-component system chemotaxis sensor kinase CheA